MGQCQSITEAPEIMTVDLQYDANKTSHGDDNLMLSAHSLEQEIITGMKQLNALPLNQTLILIYNRCRIERPIILNQGTYQGQWRNSKFCGFGRMFYDNGDYYEGYWLLGLRHHYGMFVSSKNITQIGNWFADVFIGPALQDDDLMIDKNIQRKLRQFKGVKESDKLGTKYFGDIQNGFGYMLGDVKYIGEFVNSKLDGYGIIKSKDSLYRGYVKENQRHGIGHFQVDSRIYIGEFENDKETVGFIIN